MFQSALLVAVLSALALPASAQVENLSEKLAALETYKLLMDGEAPAVSAGELLTARAGAISHLQTFKSQFAMEKLPLSENCLKFRKLSLGLIDDLEKGIQSYTGQFELGNRLQIEIAAFMTLRHLLLSKAEGGYSLLDMKARQTCPFLSRNQLLEGAAATLHALTMYFRTVFGRPGLLQMEETQRRLFDLAREDERSENRKFWIYTGVLTVASIALWEVVPIALAFGARGIWGFTPAWSVRPGVVFATRMVALTAEGFAFAYAEELAAHHPEAAKVLLGSWNEYMDSIDAILENPVHAPQLQMVLLSRVQAMVFSEYLPWLQVMGPLITKEERQFGSLEAAIRNYRQLVEPVQQEKR